MPTSELGFLPTGFSVPGSDSHSVYRLAASRSGYASASKVARLLGGPNSWNSLLGQLREQWP